MTFKKWHKWFTKKAEVKEIKEETPVTIAEENKISDDEIIDEIIAPKKEKKSAKVIGTVWDSAVVKPVGRIKFEAQVAPFPMFKVPADIRQYLMNKGLTTEAYKMTKEEMDKKNVNPEMIEKLKKFLTERL